MWDGSQGGDLTERFEANRPRLLAMAQRMLGSTSEADDAVQEAWLRLRRAGTGIDNLDAWLTTVVGRVCLDLLRSRAHRREEPLAPGDATAAVTADPVTADPEEAAVLADSVGLALLVVLDTLSPVERLAFVLHDMFAVPFDEIAPIVGRSPAATRQLTSRARRRVHAAGAVPETGGARQREVVTAFLAASRQGDFDALLALLDPDVVVRGDDAAARAGGSRELRGAEPVARFFIGRARGAVPALIDGVPGAAAFAGDRLAVALRFAVSGGRILGIEAIAGPAGLAELDIIRLGG